MKYDDYSIVKNNEAYIGWLHENNHFLGDESLVGGRDSTGGRVLCEGQKNQFVRRKLNILIMYMANTKTALAKH